MGKVNLLVKYCLINESMEYNIKGIYQNNKLIFKELENTMILDLKGNVLERKKDNKTIVLDFNKKNGIIIDNSYKLNIDIDVIELKNKKNNFYVKYKIEDNSFEIEINIL